MLHWQRAGTWTSLNSGDIHDGEPKEENTIVVGVGSPEEAGTQQGG